MDLCFTFVLIMLKTFEILHTCVFVQNVHAYEALSEKSQIFYIW